MEGSAAEAAVVGEVRASVVTGTFDHFYLREYPALLRLAVGLVDLPDRAEELVGRVRTHAPALGPTRQSGRIRSDCASECGAQ